MILFDVIVEDLLQLKWDQVIKAECELLLGCFGTTAVTFKLVCIVHLYIFYQLGFLFRKVFWLFHQSVQLSKAHAMDFYHH